MSESESRELLLAAAKSLILANGFAGTSVDAICKKAGLTKGSFYHFFSSKDRLGLAVLDWSLAKGGEVMNQGSHFRMNPSPERAFAYLRHVEHSAEQLWSGGCLLGSFALELVETNDPMQKAVSGMFQAIADQFAAELAPLTNAPAELAQQYLALLEGSIILAKAHRDPSRIVSTLRSFRKNLEAYLTNASVAV
jgi:TetR/AcrR family transcriptional regulator, transcriptional repressor for nem operon